MATGNKKQKLAVLREGDEIIRLIGKKNIQFWKKHRLLSIAQKRNGTMGKKGPVGLDE